MFNRIGVGVKEESSGKLETETIRAKSRGSLCRGGTMAAVMDEEQFMQLLWKARKSITPEEQAEVLAIVDQHEGIVHRANVGGNR